MGAEEKVEADGGVTTICLMRLRYTHYIEAMPGASRGNLMGQQEPIPIAMTTKPYLEPQREPTERFESGKGC